MRSATGAVESGIEPSSLVATPAVCSVEATLASEMRQRSFAWSELFCGLDAMRRSPGGNRPSCCCFRLFCVAVDVWRDVQVFQAAFGNCGKYRRRPHAADMDRFVRLVDLHVYHEMRVLNRG